jgi:CheY-like chemotaxis protein
MVMADIIISGATKMHQPTQADHEARSTGRNDHEAARILVVDDDTVHRMVICRIAARLGYEPVEAESYEEAETLLRGGVFVCISLDLSLGGRGGLEVMQLIADHAARTPVIVVSGGEAGARAEAAATARRLGLMSCEPLPKPVDLAELKHRLAQIKLRTEAGVRACPQA